MRTHFCHADRDWIAFEVECSWCGMKEEDVLLTTDEKFREIIRRLKENANPNITDD